jgi:hypothetical protein
MQEERMELSFKLRGYNGRVIVKYGINVDAALLGFKLFNLPFPYQNVHGFPVIQADVEFDGIGYQAYMGWIQLITVHDFNTDQKRTSIDQAPVFWDTDHPFAAFGYKPTLFDAPGPNPPRDHESWKAESYLVYCPDVVRTKKIRYILGLEWGYVLRHGTVEAMNLRTASTDDWNAHIDVLANKYTEWTFNGC